MIFSENLDINSFLILSLIGNAFLLVKYVIFGPRPPKTLDESLKNLKNTCKFLNADLLMIKDPAEDDGIFIITPPKLTKKIVKTLKDAGAKERSLTDGE